MAQLQGHLMLHRQDPFAAVLTADFSASEAPATAEPGHAEDAERDAEAAAKAGTSLDAALESESAAERDRKNEGDAATQAHGAVMQRGRGRRGGA